MTGDGEGEGNGSSILTMAERWTRGRYKRREGTWRGVGIRPRRREAQSGEQVPVCARENRTAGERMQNRAICRRVSGCAWDWDHSHSAGKVRAKRNVQCGERLCIISRSMSPRQHACSTLVGQRADWTVRVRAVVHEHGNLQACVVARLGNELIRTRLYEAK